MSNRIDRANSEIQRCLAEIIQTKLNDPRLKTLIYVSEVKVTPDFKYCKVKIGLDEENEQKLNEVVSILQKSEGFIKRELANMIRMPQVPKLTFSIDKGTQATFRINEILKNLNIPSEED